jgi:hypothetical protein
MQKIIIKMNQKKIMMSMQLSLGLFTPAVLQNFEVIIIKTFGYQENLKLGINQIQNLMIRKKINKNKKNKKINN